MYEPLYPSMSLWNVLTEVKLTKELCKNLLRYYDESSGIMKVLKIILN